MTLPDGLSERDRVEVERSTAEACKAVLAPVDVDRYLDPPADTPFALEYAFFLLGNVRGKTVLDLGCGSGESLVPLATRGALVIGIDVSSDLIQLARKRLSGYGLPATLQGGSAYATGLPDESVDVVFSMALLHHLDLPAARSEIHRILRPGGLFILREPIRFSPTMNRLRRLFPAPKGDISPFEHPMTRAEISLVTQGFTVVAERNFRLPFVPLLNKFMVLRSGVFKTDRWLLKHLPSLEHFATGKVMSLRK
jgi:SAM-dependent methyltransferase